ncbi:MAG TPA: NADH-quinone oxidoreductase subunit L, partial [Pseudolabrys sp.]
MYQAIVFLPLLGAILAGLIALAGARARFPGESPPPGMEDNATGQAAHHHEPAVTGGAVIHHSHDEPLGGHGHDDHGHAPAVPAAAGSRMAELITTTLLMVSMVLSWIAFVQVG